MHLVKQINWFTLCLWMLVYFGLFARFYNLNWSQGSILLHPDEKIIIGHGNLISFFSNLDPQFYGYNGFTLYIVGAIKMVSNVFFRGYYSDLPSLVVIGRYLSATASCLSVFLIHALARQMLKNKEAALISTVLFSLSVGSIQSAHFFTTESFLVLFLSGYLYSLFRWHRDSAQRYGIAAGVFLGLCVATKTTGLLFVPIGGVFILLYAFKSKSWKQFLVRSIILSSVSVVFFVIFNPYFFWQWERIQLESALNARMLSGADSYPWTLQFDQAGFELVIKNLFTLFGPSVPILLVPGLVFFLWKKIKNKQWPELVIVVWGILFFLYLSGIYIKFYRYLLPLSPIIVMLVSYLIMRSKLGFTVFGKMLLGATLTGSFIWALAFISIYSSPHTNIQASNYLLQIVKPEDELIKETWHEVLPLTDIFKSAISLQYTDYDIFSMSDPSSRQYLAVLLERSEYIVMSSEKIYIGMKRLAKKYPDQINYYKALFSGELGYTLQKSFHSKPRIGPLEFDDSKLEETFWVFDHPAVYIFRNTEKKSIKEFQRILQ